jgi:uncharacterized membrane protein YgdD (TMEM256/DUF423 family)
VARGRHFSPSTLHLSPVVRIPPFLSLGAISAAIAVGAGAFGAHALRARVDARMLEVWETAARYQMYHALALLLVAVLMREAEAGKHRSLRAAGWCFVAGTLVFSGSLYAMTLTGVTALGAVTPVGGVCFIAGWVVLAAGAFARP